MIYVGYQGIGKSTLANTDLKYIDLESGNFWVENKRPEDWYKYYAQIADHLSKQGYAVFTASHKVFRDYLYEKHIPFCTIFPANFLKDEWIEKLQNRYDDTLLEKDYKALMNAKRDWETNISDLATETNFICIENIDYQLNTLIEEYERINK